MASQAPVPEIRFTKPRPSSPPLRFSSSPDSAAHLPPSPPPSLLSATSPSPTAPTDIMIDEIRASADDNASNQERPASPIVLQPSEASREASLEEESAQRQGKKRGSWLRRRREPLLGSWNPTLTLQNSGSVARDHLASERTFLAYVRTSLTISSTGVALVQLFTIAATSNKSIEKFSRPLGATIIIVGMLTLILGAIRYFTIQYALIGGDFPVARINPAVLALALVILVFVVFGVLLGTR